MTWTKLSDDYGDECWSLSDPAMRLLTEMLVWSNRHLLDLRINKHELRRLAKRPEAITELLENKFVADLGEEYLIVYHGVYQRTREQVLRDQAVKRANGAKGGRPRKSPPTRAEASKANLGALHAAKLAENQSVNLRGQDRTGLDEGHINAGQRPADSTAARAANEPAPLEVAPAPEESGGPITGRGFDRRKVVNDGPVTRLVRKASDS